MPRPAFSHCRLLRRLTLTLCCLLYVAHTPAPADDVVTTARPVPATRPAMKELLEDMKQRPLRIPLPELSEQEREALGERATSYESRLRYHYLPPEEGTVFGGSGRTGRDARSAAGRAARTNPGNTTSGSGTARPDFTRNADQNMTLTYQFKTMLFWIVSRTNNCQYCLGHQEQKLAATGMTDDQIAALDADWKSYSAAEQAAFAYARLLTFEPQRLSDAAIQEAARYYTPQQILEMTMSMAWNNAINRWKEGTGVPQSTSNMFVRRGAAADTPAVPEHADTFLTPTSTRYQNLISIVAPLDVSGGQPTGRAVSTRPPLESRAEVEAALQAARTRTARLPLTDAATARAWLAETDPAAPLQLWTRLLANFPNDGRSRLPSLLARTRRTGELTELQKARVNWIIARQDRAWYATGLAQQQLQALGETDEQIFALDGDWQNFSEADQAVFRFARQLAASPIALTDADAAEALRLTSPRLVVQLINHVTSCAYFDRVTEAAGLPLEP